MRVLFVTSEVYPLVKTGGLADVSGALPKALTALGVEVHLLLPGYPKAIESTSDKLIEAEIADFMGAGPLRLIFGRTPDSALPVWLVDCPSLFRRPGGPYMDEQGQDWPDNAKRFALFNHVAALFSLGQLLKDWRADVVHANDWHAGLVPAILAGSTGRKPATVFTIHNLAYQGLFPAAFYPQLGLRDQDFSPDGVEFYGKISFLKAGIRYSDRVTTVSPGYAKEILTAEYGCGLEGLLACRAKDLVGILNGADYEIWDPVTDIYLPANFNFRNISGKLSCKRELQKELGLEAHSEAALVVFVSRIAEQKMADIVAAALPEIVESGSQFALLGDGDRRLEDAFKAAARHYPGRIAARVGYEEPLAHRYLAGGDILLHPSRFEPCALTPLYAMRYGAVPIVRNTGGLRDTVVDATEDSIVCGAATGFAFESANGADMVQCLERALALYRQPLAWRRIQQQAMAIDFGWAESARNYLAVYRALTVTPLDRDCPSSKCHSTAASGSDLPLAQVG